MSMGELEHLIQMANQISANFNFYDDQVPRITDHITRYWAPSMRKLFSEYIQSGGQGVDDAVREAMKEVRFA